MTNEIISLFEYYEKEKGIERSTMVEALENALLSASRKSIGPALITASVVIGPGSILSASKIGHQFGYDMSWVLLLAILLMIGMTALSARLGVTLENTLCEELAQRAGRPLAALAGVTLFLIAACFQFGNFVCAPGRQ